MAHAPLPFGELEYDLISDAHSDIWGENQRIDWAAVRTPGVDTLVIAGDIADDPAWVEIELRRLAQVYKNLVYIPGNHEYERLIPDFAATRDVLRAICAKVNAEGAGQIHFLHDEPYIENGVAIVGRYGGWTFDFGGRPQQRAESVQHILDDPKYQLNPQYQQIVGLMDREAREDYYALRQEIIDLQRDPAVVSIAIVTHTLSNPNYIAWGKYPKKDESVGLYGNSLMLDVLNLDEGKIRIWMSGHSHAWHDAVEHDVRFVAHPRGRPKDFNRVTYAPQCIHIQPPQPAAMCMPPAPSLQPLQP